MKRIIDHDDALLLARVIFLFVLLVFGACVLGLAVRVFIWSSGLWVS